MSIRFYFDFISPYSYLGWKRIHEVAERHERMVEPVPVLFAAILDAHGQLGPAEIPAKRAYTFKHVLRLAHDQGIRLEPPPAHPFNPLLGLRIAGLELEKDVRRRVIDALYDATWAGGPGITDAGVVERILDDLGLSGSASISEAQSDANKAKLRHATEDAVARGVFGVPTTEADGELFWGQDAFGHLERFLQGDDPVPPNWQSRWGNLPAHAHRPRTR